MRQGIVYKISCLTCADQNQDVAYIGESSRTPFDRGGEWLDSINRRVPDSPLEEHASNQHPEQPRRFKMEILKFTGNPLVRQTTEAHLITKQSLKGIALNRKGEWGQNLAPKLILDGQEPPQRKSGKLRGGREEGKEGGKEEVEKEGQGEEGGKEGEVDRES